MNRKISVFILLILLASSFKYRAKTVESLASAKQAEKSSVPEMKKSAEDSFEDFTVRLQKANQELVSGNPGPLKELWSKNQDPNVAGPSDDMGLKDMMATEIKFDGAKNQSSATGEYSYENIATEVGADLAYLLQTEHYHRPGAKQIDLQVTTLCRKEKEGWKIVQRHAVPLNPR